MSSMLPGIGSSGIFTAAEPFSTLLKANVSYTCIAIRKFSELLKSNINPQAIYYTPNELDATVYAKDLAADVSLLTLQDTSGAVINFPSSYLTSYPSIGGVSYTSIAISVRLGPVPDSLDLSYIKSIIKERCLEVLGVDAKLDTVALSAKTILDDATDARLTAVRQQNIKTNPTDHALMLKAQADLATAKQQIAQLEAYIAKNVPVTVVDTSGKPVMPTDTSVS